VVNVVGATDSLWVDLYMKKTTSLARLPAERRGYGIHPATTRFIVSGRRWQRQAYTAPDALVLADARPAAILALAPFALDTCHSRHGEVDLA